MAKKIVIALVVIVILAVAGWCFWFQPPTPTPAPMPSPNGYDNFIEAGKMLTGELTNKMTASREELEIYVGKNQAALKLARVGFGHECRVRTQFTPAGAVAYYRGTEGRATSGAPLLFERSFSELLDVTHAHAFSQSFLFFVLCHIFALTKAGDRLKIVVYCLAFGTTAVDLAVPYLIRYASPAFSPLQVGNSAAMTLVLLILLAIPTYEMWVYRGPETIIAP